MSRGTKLFVGNLSYNATQDELTDTFAQFGPVSDCFFPTDRETGRMRGFAFVTLESGHEEAIKQLDNSEFMGRNLKVNVAEGKKDGGGGGGGYGGGGGRGGGGGYGGGGGNGGGSYGGGGGGGDYGGAGTGGGGGDYGGAGDGGGGRGRGRGRGGGGGQIKEEY